MNAKKCHPKIWSTSVAFDLLNKLCATCLHGRLTRLDAYSVALLNCDLAHMNWNGMEWNGNDHLLDAAAVFFFLSSLRCTLKTSEYMKLVSR